ncbi:HAT domain-containing protein [Ilyonectria robusta]
MEADFPQPAREAQVHIRQIRRYRGLGDGPEQVGNNASDLQSAPNNAPTKDITELPGHPGYIAHFINRSGKIRTAVLALRELVGEHLGENMADVLLHIFGDYGISSRIGYFMADNATSNDACIELVLQALYPNISKKHRLRRRLRCFGHIVNLGAQAFIMGKDAEKTCKDLESSYREGDFARIGELWERRGAIGRLHNIVRYIRASPQQRQFFRSIEIGGELAAFDGLEEAARLHLWSGLERPPDPAPIQSNNITGAEHLHLGLQVGKPLLFSLTALHGSSTMSYQ